MSSRSTHVVADQASTAGPRAVVARRRALKRHRRLLLEHLEDRRLLASIDLEVTTPIYEGQSANLTVTIGDPPAETFGLTVDWGDGSEVEMVDLPAGTTSFDVPHTYADDNADDQYTITVTLQDDDMPVGTGEPVLANSTLYGGVGDQVSVYPDYPWGNGELAISGNRLYLAGHDRNVLGGQSLAVAYELPSGVAEAPTFQWAKTWPGQASVAWKEMFSGVAGTSEGAYFTGNSYTQTIDDIGGKEAKSILVKFQPDGTPGSGVAGAVWQATPNLQTSGTSGYFSYGGEESHSALIAAEEGGVPYLYAVGGGQPWSYGAYVVAKYDTNGQLVAAATDSTVGINFNVGWVPSGGGGSSAQGVTVINGNVYALGLTAWAVEGDAANPRPALWKYNSNLQLLWRGRDTSRQGNLLGAAGLNDAIYAVGYQYVSGSPNSEDYLIQKYDEAGNLLWSATSGGAGTDVLTGIVTLNNRLFAVGHTASEGAGDKDAVLVEIDPANGSFFSKHLFGGALVDRANAVATDGVDLYVAGQSSSFASGDNLVGQSDLFLLRYTVGSEPVSTSVTMNVYNLPPTIHSVANSGPVEEGSPVTVTIHATDPAGERDPLTYVGFRQRRHLRAFQQQQQRIPHLCRQRRVYRYRTGQRR
jgi:hypothetical protein